MKKITGIRENSSGFSLIEMMIIVGIMGVMTLALSTMMENQTKSTNFLEFQLKKTQLHGAILGQVLTDPNNCKCIFSYPTVPAVFPANPAAPGAVLTGVTPTQVGTYSFISPGNCATATANPLISTAGIDSLTLNSVQLKDLMKVGTNSYTGNLLLSISTNKKVIGPSSLAITIPVNVATTASGSNVAFASCSTSAATTSFVPYQKFAQCTQHCESPPAGSCSADPLPTCLDSPLVPPASKFCNAGDTAIDVGCEVTGDYQNWDTVACHRLCFSGSMPSGFVYEYHCPFGLNNNYTYGHVQCLPTACPAGTTQKDLSCQSTYTGSGYMAGFCRRTCVNN